MASKELVARTRTIVATPDRLEMMLRVAHQRGRLLTDPDEIHPYFRADGTAIVKVRMLLPARRPSLWRRWCSWNTVAGSLTKALLFALALTMLGLSLLAVIAAWAMNQIVSVGWPALVGPAVLVLALMFALNRTNHSGGCPGVAVHCKGCKH